MSGQSAENLGAGAPNVGDVIAQKYRVEGLVGRGGMGVVVSARHVQLGQSVAIKLLTLPPDEDRRDEAIGRFLNEALAAARLRSDHVVRIYDVGQLESGLPFMVMELLSGVDLGSMLDQRGPLPEAEAVDYVLQACAGVAEAHQAGIVHRDLKPSNLFVTQRSDGLPLLKVLDFGISKQLSDPNSGELLPTFTNTRTLMGSPNYMSPEQVRDARRVDARTDIWAMGIILQELITDAPVFRGESFPGVCAAIVADPPMPVRTMRPDVSDRLEAIIERCLQKDVQKRYQSIAELVGDLVPLGTRSVSGPQAVVYSSHPRIVSAGRRQDSKPSGAASISAHDQTLAMPSGTPHPGGTPDSTLESARLQPPGNTHSALSSPDSRIEVVAGPPIAPARSGLRWIVPLAAGLVLAAGLLWLRGRPEAVSAVASSELPSVSAPPSNAAPFTLSIDSDPVGASVSEGSVRLGTTPFSLTLDLPEGASPRVFVVEKDGYQPYVVRQGAAHGQVRVMAALSPKLEAPAAAAAVPEPAPALSPKPAPQSNRPHAAPAPKRPPPPAPAKPQSDIRLER
ncbi:MAG TPA: serine/threonine-protein kinase [Polyangiaceae bacterium]|nr:serine/threonine-protein kinase [Polyangiaceae bacterium]